jgi:hypothetical protein
MKQSLFRHCESKGKPVRKNEAIRLFKPTQFNRQIASRSHANPALQFAMTGKGLVMMFAIPSLESKGKPVRKNEAIRLYKPTQYNRQIASRSHANPALRFAMTGAGLVMMFAIPSLRIKEKACAQE